MINCIRVLWTFLVYIMLKESLVFSSMYRLRKGQIELNQATEQNKQGAVLVSSRTFHIQVGSIATQGSFSCPALLQDGIGIVHVGGSTNNGSH